MGKCQVQITDLVSKFQTTVVDCFSGSRLWSSSSRAGIRFRFIHVLVAWVKWFVGFCNGELFTVTSQNVWDF